MPINCVECNERVRAPRTMKCQCWLHKQCIPAIVRRAILDREGLTCPRCGLERVMQAVMVTKVLRRELRLSAPMFYGGRQLTPCVDDERCKPEELEKYQKEWDDIVFGCMQRAPEWLLPRLKLARKKRVERRTTRSKWD